MRALMRFGFMAVLMMTAASGGEWDGKVFCGYQGWFRCEGDGAKVGWRHYGEGSPPSSPKIGIEIWPDVSELRENETYPTLLTHDDGRVAKVFSSVDRQTVMRHFEWMRDYGIDGAFLQRFATETRDDAFRVSLDSVLENVSKSSSATGRQWALMYDTSGLEPGQFEVLEKDLARLESDGLLAVSGANYVKHCNKPLVATWGLGFNDRKVDFDEWEKWIRHLHGKGYAVMLGVPYYWRSLDRDCLPDPRLHEVMALADVVSPWAVGRFATADDARRLGEEVMAGDVEWCRERGITYLPVAFPGFSWHNLMKTRGIEAEFDEIPRRGGRFLWAQAIAQKMAGAKSVYVAMFDEMDEGTAVFKFTNDAPSGAPFLKEEGVPGDRYLKVCGAIGEWLRDERGDGWPDL